MTPGEEFRKREDRRPDEFTLAWWRSQFQECLKGYRGASHAVNKCIADYEEWYRLLKDIERGCKELESRLEAVRAELGKLNEELKRVADRQDAIAKYVKENVPKGGQ